MSNYITIATFLYSHQVYVAKTKLESEGIDAFLKDELMGSTYPGAVGIDLQVEEHNAENAIRILTECGYI